MTVLSFGTTQRRRSSERGAAFVEAAVVTPALLVVLLVSIQFMYISFRALSLQWITTAAMRNLVLSQCEEGPEECPSDGPAAGRTLDPQLRLAFAKATADTMAQSLGLSLGDDSPETFCVRDVSSGSLPAINTENCQKPGVAGSTIHLSVSYPMPLFFSKLFFVELPTVTLRGQALGIVEAFPQRN